MTFKPVACLAILALLNLAAAGEAPPLNPQDALKSFAVAPDLRVELVAAEPLVIDPVDMAFDEDGGLYVAEMIDYPFPEGMGKGQIRYIKDTDGDGVLDKSSVLADGLAWPTSVACWDGGVFVGVASALTYFKDTDGDGKADIKQEFFTGFRSDSSQMLLNSFRWSIENKFTGVCGNGGRITSKLKPGLDVSLSGRDFAFTPQGGFEAVSGGGQFGATFDDFGRRFTCSNAMQARQIVLEDRYIKRNPHLPVATAIVSIASDGDSGLVFRASPVEQWRVLRTEYRKVNKGHLEHGGTAAGYFTSATGITMLRGSALGPDYYGNLFIGEVMSNLIHRKKVSPNGSAFVADRIEQKSEFLTSTDIRFRPVNFANGPDGAFYICDMYRECVELPSSIPDQIRKDIDLKTQNLGRIWRVTSKNAPKAKAPRLSTAPIAEIVEALRHPDAWWRETAARLIFQRQDKAAVPALEALAQNNNERPATRAGALWALQGLNSLRNELVAGALRDAAPEVREHALRLAEPRLAQAPQLKADILALTESNPRTQFQLALTLGEIDDPAVADSLARLAVAENGDRWLRIAILTSASKCAVPLLAKCAAADADFLRTLALTIGARGDDKEVAAALAANKSAAVVGGLAEGLRGKGVRLIDKYPDLLPVFAEAATLIKSKAPAPKRIEAIRFVAFGDFKTAQTCLPELIVSNETAPVRLAALRAWVSFDDPSIGAGLLANWAALTPALQTEVLGGWFNRPERLEPLLAALEQKKVQATDLPGELKKRLLQQFKARAEAVVEEDEADRKAVVDRYRKGSLKKHTDKARGEAVYKATCASCHRANGAGAAVGPDLETVSHRNSEELLLHILDPNVEVQAPFRQWTVKMKDGRLLSGIKTSETGTSVTLKNNLEEVTVQLAEAKTPPSQGNPPSLMPEGLENNINLQQMADLLEFIHSLSKK